jgi:cytochrome c oxidase subunit 1
MTAIDGVFELRPTRSTLAEWVTTTDHKQIGLLYISSAFGFFAIGGILALIIRTQLAQPGLHVVSNEAYDQVFTMHGTIMLLFFATPMAVGFGNYLIPLQIGAADMSFPRLNALSYWIFLFGGLITLSGFATASGAADTGWTGYAPLTLGRNTPGPGLDLWIMGVGMVGISGILGAVNFMATIYARRAPGMHMWRMPVFTWNMLITSLLILFAFPPLTAALAMLFLDRRFGATFFDPAAGGDPILWQHLFWWFGHPEVYIIALPFFGIVSEIIPVFSRKPLFGYRLIILATISIAGLSMAVWAHHMFTTGLVSLPFFSLTSLLIAVPTGIKIFNWSATMIGGRITFPTAMLFATGVIYVFVVGGITGVMLASPPLDYDFQDTYFVVAHMHNVIIGSTVFATFAGMYFWFPKMTGRFLSERLGKVHFWTWIVGFTMTFLPQYQLGLAGMPRRVADYPNYPGWAELNLISSIGAVLLGLGTIPLFLAVFRALRQPPTATDDPWEANSLEWATASPPPHHNFRRLPPIRSERPVFDERMRRRGIDPRELELGAGGRGALPSSGAGGSGGSGGSSGSGGSGGRGSGGSGGPGGQS